MAGAKRHEELFAWRLCVRLSEIVLEITARGAILNDARFRSQLRDSASAAPALIAEGFCRYSDAEFVRYLRLARGELGEVQSHLTLARTRGCFSPAQLETATAAANHAMAVTTLLLKSKLRG